MELIDCRNRTDLYRMLDLSGSRGPAVEVGVAEGCNAFDILSLWPNLTKLYLVDPWEHQSEEVYADGCNMSDVGMSQMYEDCVNRLLPFPGRYEIYRELSVSAAAKLAKRKVRLALGYIDANHCYEAVAEDIQLWYPLIMSGGIFAGHDYDEGHAGLRQAVNEFVARENLQLIRLDQHSDCSWAVRKP
jgi:hypothetical protein